MAGCSNQRDREITLKALHVRRVDSNEFKWTHSHTYAPWLHILNIEFQTHPHPHAYTFSSIWVFPQTQTQAHTNSNTFIHSLTHSHTDSLSHSHTHTLTHSHTHTLTHSHTHTLNNTHAHSPLPESFGDVGSKKAGLVGVGVQLKSGCLVTSGTDSVKHLSL